MKDPRIAELFDLAQRDLDIKQMCRLVCDANGATSVGHLYDVDREEFVELYDAAMSLVAQLPDPSR